MSKNLSSTKRGPGRRHLDSGPKPGRRRQPSRRRDKVEEPDRRAARYLQRYTHHFSVIVNHIQMARIIAERTRAQ